MIEQPQHRIEINARPINQKGYVSQIVVYLGEGTPWYYTIASDEYRDVQKTEADLKAAALRHITDIGKETRRIIHPPPPNG